MSPTKSKVHAVQHLVLCITQGTELLILWNPAWQHIWLCSTGPIFHYGQLQIILLTSRQIRDRSWCQPIHRAFESAQRESQHTSHACASRPQSWYADQLGRQNDFCMHKYSVHASGNCICSRGWAVLRAQLGLHWGVLFKSLWTFLPLLFPIVKAAFMYGDLLSRLTSATASVFSHSSTFVYSRVSTIYSRT